MYNNIQSQIAALEAEIKSLQFKHTSLQQLCSHPKEIVNKVHKSDTGNWDKGDDSYWIEYHCTCCNKKWTEDQ